MSKLFKSETFLLSLKALAVDWNKPEEDEAWASLQTPILKNTKTKGFKKHEIPTRSKKS